MRRSLSSLSFFKTVNWWVSTALVCIPETSKAGAIPPSFPHSLPPWLTHRVSFQSKPLHGLHQTLHVNGFLLFNSFLPSSPPSSLPFSLPPSLPPSPCPRLRGGARIGW